MKRFGKLALAGALIFVLLQCVRPSIPSKPAESEINASPAVRQILQKDCYSCHSDQRRLAWFDEIVPGYWLVRHDVLTARRHLNFSALGAKPAAAQRAALYESVNMIQLGSMPLQSFRALHPDANVTSEELAALKAYLAPWSNLPTRPGVMPSPAGKAAAQASLGAVKPEYNGLAFDPAFEGWKLLDTTDRGDNNTFRFVLGNDVAIKAVQTGNIFPWPDGARFAKVAWTQDLGPDGLLHPGQFVQVELMVKDARLYKKTNGWGWGRWRSLDLRPYGTDEHFVDECTGCHLPVRADDSVYTLPITLAVVKGSEVVNNQAALPSSLPYRPLDWNPITMYVDPRNRTTATLFGNDAALRRLRTSDEGDGAVPYPEGSVLALVTWAQRDDPHWFGARIPARPLSVEFVELSPTGQPNQYRRFEGEELTEIQWPIAAQTQRTQFVLSLAPAPLP